MLRSKPPSRGETVNHRTMKGNLKNQIQLWEEISVTLDKDEGSRNSRSKNHNKSYPSEGGPSSSLRGSLEASPELSSPNVVLRSKVT